MKSASPRGAGTRPGGGRSRLERAQVVPRPLRFRRGRHRHDFFVDVAGGTRVGDVVDYEMPLGPIGGWARRVFVARSLDRVFDFRQEAVAEVFDR